MTIDSITYIGIHLSSNSGANDAIIRVRVVPDGKKGNEVYGRTLNIGERDSGQSITLGEDETLVFPQGSVKVTLQDVDQYAHRAKDGYAAVANTVWTWLNIPPHPKENFFNYLLAAARRLDMAYALCVRALYELGNRADEPFMETRIRVFNALGHAELMCIAFNRVISMIKDARAKFSATTAVPCEVDNILGAITAIRDAFEHIDERAMGKARQEGAADAMSIFNQGDLVASNVLRYANHSLDLRAEVIPTLVAARKFIVDVIAEAGSSKKIDHVIKFDSSEFCR